MGHSNDARRTLAGYKIGELPPSERRPERAVGAGGGGVGLGGLVAALLVGAIAAGASYFFFVASE